jgi:hypothetical protein
VFAIPGLDRGLDRTDLLGSSPLWWMIKPDDRPRCFPGYWAVIPMAGESTLSAGWWRR